VIALSGNSIASCAAAAVCKGEMDVLQQRDFSMRRLYLAIGSIGINVQSCTFASRPE